MLAEAHDLPKHLDDTLVTADATVKRLGALADDVDATVKENRPHIREFSTVGLGQVSQLATQMRGLVDTLTHLSQQLERDPNRLVFGERRQGYTPP
jgi:phospholipid/cholesterol/gamma-HCH transport system substrate-binding protein